MHCDGRENMGNCYDVIVAGGGTAGTAAAIAASRRNHKVLLIEEQNCLGGTSTSGGVGEWFASLQGMGNIFDAVVAGLEKFGARFAKPRHFNPEVLKSAWQLLAEEAGVQILFHASVCGAERSGRAVSRIEVASCSRLFSAEAKYFIDATGEGDLSALAGAEYMQGEPGTRKVLHMSLVAWMYDTGTLQTPYLPASLEPVRSREELPGLGAGVLVDRNRVYLNATKVLDRDPTDPWSLSDAEREARHQLLRVVHYLQTHEYPTFALASSGARIGIREGRRVVGDCVLSRADILDRREPLDFEDGVVVATSQIDFHSLKKAGNSGWRQPVLPYSIPLRCMLAKGFPNLAVAGKCISVDQVVHSSCRMTPTCCAMGQAAGTAAALAIETGVADLRDVPISSLRQTLNADGMELNPARHTAFAPHDTRLDADDHVGI